jgi:hypothetical protein
VLFFEEQVREKVERVNLFEELLSFSKSRCAKRSTW